MILRSLTATALAALCVLGAACKPAPVDGPAPDVSRPAAAIVVVTIENWSEPGLSANPIPADTWPGLVRIDDASTSCPQVRPAVASALTGASPERVGVLDNHTSPLPADPAYVPATLKGAGYRTAAFVSSPIVGWGSGLERGFDLFDAPKNFAFGPFRRTPPIRPAAELATNFRAWVASLAPRATFFAWLHLNGRPLGMGRAASPPQAVGPSEQIAAALREVAAALTDAGRADGTAIIITGVAGALVPADGKASGYFLEPVALTIPFAYRPSRADLALSPSAVAWLPDVAAIVLNEAAVRGSLPDGALPVADAARARYATVWQGRTDFEWPVEAGAIVSGRLAVSLLPGATTLARSWPAGDDLPDDPGAAAEVALAARATSLSVRDVERSLPAEARAILEGAGVKVPVPGRLRTPASRDTRMASMPLIAEAREWAWDPAPRYAARSFDRVLAQDPANIGAHVESGEIFALGKMYKKARTRLEAALAMNPSSGEAWHWLGHVELGEERLGAAEAVLRAAEHLSPHDADVLYDLACLHSRQGDAVASESFLRRAWAAGFRNAAHIQADPDLRNLREDPLFARFMQDVIR